MPSQLATPAPAPAAPAPTAAPAPPITPEQARQALEVLNDPAKRAAITATLEAIARAQPATATTGDAAPGAPQPRRRRPWAFRSPPIASAPPCWSAAPTS